MNKYIKILVIFFSFSLYGAQACLKKDVSASSSVQGNSQIITLGNDSVITSVKVSPDSRLIASGDAKGKLIIWDANSYKHLKTLPTSAYLRSLSWSPDSKKIVAVYRDKTIKLWDVQKGVLLKNLGLRELPTYVSWAPGKQICAVSLKDEISIFAWNADYQELGRVNVLRGNLDSINALSWSSNSQYLVAGGQYKNSVTGDYDQSVSVWDALSHPDLDQEKDRIRVNEIITDVSWAPGDKQIAFSSKNRTVSVYKWNALLNKFGKYKKFEFNDIPTRIAWSPDAEYLVVGFLSGSLIIIDSFSGDRIGDSKYHFEPITALQWPNDKYIISGSADKTIKIWNDPLSGYQSRTFRMFALD